jgi:hypothetical protein
MRTWIFILVATAAVLMISPDRYGHAEPVWIGPETFFDPRLLARAIEDVKRMELPELQSFSIYLAQCQDDIAPPILEHACRAAREMYRL